MAAALDRLDVDAHAPGNWDCVYGAERFLETFAGDDGNPARLRTAAAFIRRAMPYDRPGTLADLQAFDLAALINGRPRPDFRGKENDWPLGNPPPDVAYHSRAASGRRGRAPRAQ